MEHREEAGGMTTPETWEVGDERALPTVVATLLSVLKTRAGDGATVLALHGDLGAGKTTLVQHLGRTLGVEVPITSPTFVIMKQYPTADTHFATLAHLDAYRLDTPEELTVLGFSALLAQPHTLVCVEWAEKVVELLPPHTAHLTITVAPGGERTLHLT